jgi:hypothetical protein
MLPKMLECSSVWKPVFFHRGKEGGSSCTEERSDRMGLWGRVAVGRVCAIAEIGPGEGC